MGKQQSFAALAWQEKEKTTRREQFLKEMDAIIPWKRLFKLIKRHYAKGSSGRSPVGLETMFRIHFLQIWFGLSDPAAEDALYDSESMRRFVGLELERDATPDETTILRFRHPLEEKDWVRGSSTRSRTCWSRRAC